MTESFVLIEDDYKEICKRYMMITETEEMVYDMETIICDDVRFEDRNGWCLMTLFQGDEIAEEILIMLSNKKKLLYFFSDEVQINCEFLVLDNDKVMRKKYIYYDLPNLNRDEGHLKIEEKRKFLHWSDIDYFIGIAREDPYKFFEY